MADDLDRQLRRIKQHLDTAAEFPSAWLQPSGDNLFKHGASGTFPKLPRQARKCGAPSLSG